MDTDDAYNFERTGANARLNPMFGDWQHRFQFSPVPYGDGGKRREAFRRAVQSEMKNKFFYSSDIQIEVTLYLDIQKILETSDTADLDNYAKSILDSIKGVDGIIFDDSQIQSLHISWMNGQGSNPYFDISISGLPEDFMIKPVAFYEMPDRLWYPHGRMIWTDGRIEELSERDHYVSLVILEAISSSQVKSRHLLRQSGMGRHRAYQRARCISSSARGFHKSRIDAAFETFSLCKWYADFTKWKCEYVDDIFEFERIAAEIRFSYSRMAELLVGKLSGIDHN